MEFLPLGTCIIHRLECMNIDKLNDMNALDFFWYMFYRFSFYTCKRDEDNAKWVATLGTSAFLGLMIDIIIAICLYLFYYQFFCDYWRSYSTLILLILTGIVMIAYFYGLKKVNTDSGDVLYATYSPRKRKRIWIAFAFIAISPLLAELTMIFALQ